MGNDGMSDIGHWTADHVPVEAYDRMRAEKDRLAAELEACKRHHEKSIVKCRQRLQGAVEALDEAITTLGLLCGYVEMGSEPWDAINACQRRLMTTRGQ